MRFEWNEQKRLGNIRKHGIDFIGVEALFLGFTLTIPDERFAYSERRFITLGLMNQRVVAVAHTETPDTIRIISIRKAYRHEQKAYFEYSPYPHSPH